METEADAILNSYKGEATFGAVGGGGVELVAVPR
jgi:hypothetical protein